MTNCSLQSIGLALSFSLVVAGINVASANISTEDMKNGAASSVSSPAISVFDSLKREFLPEMNLGKSANLSFLHSSAFPGGEEKVDAGLPANSINQDVTSSSKNVPVENAINNDVFQARLKGAVNQVSHSSLDNHQQRVLKSSKSGDSSRMCSTPYSGSCTTAVFRNSAKGGLNAPECTAAASCCDTGASVKGRGTDVSRLEPNAPNTIDACTDGNAADYEYNDRIIVRSKSGSTIQPGSAITIEAVVFTTNRYDYATFFYSTQPDKINKRWTYIGTAQASEGNKLCTVSVDHTISTAVASGSKYAIRVVFDYVGYSGPTPTDACPEGSWDDVDDVVFKLGGI